MNNFTIKTHETSTKMLVTLVFDEPFYVGQECANGAARQRAIYFLRENNYSFRNTGRINRINSHTFEVAFYK